MSQTKILDDKKTALKLINKYADSYNRSEEENKSLKKEIIDLKTTLALNKDIIKGMMGSSNKSDHNNIFISKLKEENLKLSNTIESLTNEKKDLRDKLTLFEQTYQESFIKSKDENERLKNKCFYLENVIYKKENLIINYKNKYDRLARGSDDFFGKKVIERELYIAEPTYAINQLHNELCLYKTFHENMSNQMKDFNLKVEKYEKIIHDQHQEIMKLRKKLKTDPNLNLNISQVLNIEDEKQIIPSSKVPEGEEVNVMQTDEDNDISLYSPIAEHFPVKVNMNKSHSEYKEFFPTLDLNLKKKTNTINSRTIENKDSELPKYFESSEWNEILQIVSLTNEDIQKLKKNKIVEKLINAFEIVTKMILGKNIQIKNFEANQAEIDQRLKDLTQENQKLMKQLNNLIQNSKYFIKSHENGGPFHFDNNNLDESMVGNVSKLTAQNLNNSINNDLNDSKIQGNEINIQSEIENDERNCKMLKKIENEDELEIKINDDVFNDLKLPNKHEGKKNKTIGTSASKKFSPAYSIKMNNLLKILDGSQTMTLNDSLNFVDKKLNNSEVKTIDHDSSFILENGNESLNFEIKF